MKIDRRRPHKYQEWENEIIREGMSAGLTSYQIAESLPDRKPASVRDRANKMGLYFGNAGRPPTKKKKKPTGCNTKRRRCLIGGETFDARTDEDGRFLEFSCQRHRLQASKHDRTAMI